MQDLLIMIGCCRYDNNVFLITYILNLGNVVHILSKMGRSIH